jgi:hypothetical protein
MTAGSSSEDAPPVFVQIGQTGRRLAVGRLPWGYAVEDLDERRRLGELRGDLTPFIVTVENAPHIVLAGERDAPATDHVVIGYPDDGHDSEVCLVKNDVWMSTPRPFTPGMSITASWRDKNDRELWHQQSPPLHPDTLGSMLGPTWHQYELDSSRRPPD